MEVVELVTELYTDGGCRNNPNGIGGWGVVVVRKGKRAETYNGAFEAASNNQMELMAVIRGLEMVPADQDVIVWTDSAYIVNCFKQEWWKAWVRRGWKKYSGDPVKNQALWIRLLHLVFVKRKNSKTVFKHVKGHSGNRYNEMADALVQHAINGVISGSRVPEKSFDFHDGEFMIWGVTDVEEGRKEEAYA